jgi:uncharacterized protein (DUF488 family)
MKNLSICEEKIILTFGYGNRKDYEAFINYLQEFRVTCVIDVRLSPRAWSRKWYGEAIEKLCTSKNVRYVSKSSLGNLSGCSHWVPPKDEEADQTLSEVAKMLEEGNVLLLCAEMDSSKCHRSEVASKLQALVSTSIRHLV